MGFLHIRRTDRAGKLSVISFAKVPYKNIVFLYYSAREARRENWGWGERCVVIIQKSCDMPSTKNVV